VVLKAPQNEEAKNLNYYVYQLIWVLQIPQSSFKKIQDNRFDGFRRSGQDTKSQKIINSDVGDRYG